MFTLVIEIIYAHALLSGLITPRPQNPVRSDITGAIVKADKPIAVMSGML